MFLITTRNQSIYNKIAKQLSQKRDTRFRCFSKGELLKRLLKAVGKVEGQTSVLCLKILRDVSSYIVVAQQLTEGGVTEVLSNLLDSILMRYELIVIILKSLFFFFF